MPKAKKKSTKSKLLNWLNPKSPAKGALLFVIVFAVIGGSYTAYRSFAATPCINSTFKQGSTGTCVNDITYMLNATNTPPSLAPDYVMSPQLPVNGTYNSATALTVGNFQKLVGIKVDGVVGPATWVKFCSLYGSKSMYNATRNVYIKAGLAAANAGCTMK